jgi:hypothetical protein
LKRILAILGLAMPALAQYAGPAILSRGDAPTGLSVPQIDFRPFLEIASDYDTGLAGVSVNAQGQLGNAASVGVEFVGGISGTHSWRHTKISLDYKGDLHKYTRTTYYDSADQSMLLGIKHQFTRHINLNLRETGGMFSRDPGLLGLSQNSTYDPTSSYVPLTDFFDNRTIYLSTQADLIIQRSARLSFDFGGDGFINRRRSSALDGVIGYSARADVQYRVSRRTTIGADYTFTNFSFNHVFSDTDIHSVMGTFAMTLSRRLEFSGFAGVSRYETKFINVVAVDPVITALLGITQGFEVIHRIGYTPNLSGRLSRTFYRGVGYISGSHTITPGNGLFLTSTVTSGAIGYTYTGLRRWSLNAQAGYDKARSVGNVIGDYGGESGRFTVTRQITRSLHAVASFWARQYASGDFTQYNRLIYETRIGIGFTPGDIPLRVW